MPLARAYFDSSVVVKRYLHEPGSQPARDVMRRNLFVSSAIAPLETLSAVSRRFKAGELGAKILDAIVSKLELDRLHWELVPVGNAVLERAEEIVRTGNVRALDAIHIACALSFNEGSRDRILFFSADEKQLDAAASFGLRVQRIG